MKIANLFASKDIDLSAVGLMQDELFPHYFCTPLNAVIFANLGVDGIHFCIIPNENNLAFEQAPVYVVNPMMPDHYVEVVAENFYDFISLVVSVKDAGALECISYSDREKYSEYLQAIPQNDPVIKNALTAISSTFPIKDIDDVYAYVRDMQAKIDLSKIQFTAEYYEITGRR